MFAFVVARTFLLVFFYCFFFLAGCSSPAVARAEEEDVVATVVSENKEKVMTENMIGLRLRRQSHQEHREWEQEEQEQEQLYYDDNDGAASRHSNWNDCSVEMGIENPSLSFSYVASVPAVVTKTSHQIIYKTMSSTSSLQRIEAQLTQMYKLFNKHWITFLKTPYMNECIEHDGQQIDDNGIHDGPLCPMIAHTNVTIFTIHPPLNPLTPYGLYRSRQLYRNADTKELIGCVDMRFLYCEHEHGHDNDQHDDGGSINIHDDEQCRSSSGGSIASNTLRSSQ